MAIPLIMFKLGVMTTLLGFLTLIAIKTLGIGAILLMTHLSAFLAKFHHFKWGHEGGPPQDVHVHIHKDAHGYPVHSYHGHSGWDKIDTDPEYYNYSHLSRLNFLNNLYRQDNRLFH